VAAASTGSRTGLMAGMALPPLVGLLLIGTLLLPTRRSRRARVTAATLAWSLLATACGTHQAAERVSAYGAGWSAGTQTFMHAGVGAGPVLFTDGSGNVVEERRFEPFGAPIDSRRQVGTGYVVGDPDFVARDLNELNKRTDAATGWSYHGARWLAPETARWLTPDPPVKAPDPKFMEQPWALNPYQYVDQNPISYWDPDGRDKKSTPGVNIKVKLIDVKGTEHRYTSDSGWSYKIETGKQSVVFQADATRVGLMYQGVTASHTVQAPEGEYLDGRASLKSFTVRAGVRSDMKTGTVEATVGASFVEGSGGVTVGGIDTDVTVRCGLQIGIKIGGGVRLDAGPISISFGAHSYPEAEAPKLDLPTGPEDVSMKVQYSAHDDPPPPPHN
jgi:RHS repeat-associated protein